MGATDDAKALALILAATNQRVVFAESCTGGLVSATLARIPGISEYHCGSAVTYRVLTKQNWLGVSSADLQQFGAVSETVARQMAVGVLEKTPEADYSAAVTGHLGPDAPKDLDGVIYVSVARSDEGTSTFVDMTRHELQQNSRGGRQEEAASIVVRRLASIIADAEALP